MANWECRNCGAIVSVASTTGQTNPNLIQLLDSEGDVIGCSICGLKKGYRYIFEQLPPEPPTNSKSKRSK